VYVYAYVYVRVHIHTRTCTRKNLKSQKKYLVLLLSFVLILACLVRVRAPCNQESRQKPEEVLDTAFQDDSGSKLRDKEQQRLSSK